MTTKREIVEIIEKMPDDASLEQIIYELYVREKVGRGLEDVKAGWTVSHDEVMRDLAEGLQSAGR